MNPKQKSYSPVNDVKVKGYKRIRMGNRSSPGFSDGRSSSSESTSDQEASNSSVQSPDTTWDHNSLRTDKPYLKIIDPPTDKYRFRYKTEMQGTHGAILAERSKRSGKSFPKVKLCNYKIQPGTKAIIRVSLYSAEDDEAARTPHFHRLVGKMTRNEEEVDDPLDWPIDDFDYTAELQSMTILCTKKDEQLKELMDKKHRHLRRMLLKNSDHLGFSPTEKFKIDTILEINRMNKNKVCLRFQALLDTGGDHYDQICEPIFSNPICNLKNTETNDLKICRVDKVCGSCRGHEEVFIFVDKVNKKDIKIRFYNEDLNWSAYASFAPEDVHRQFGIVFKTPPFQDLNIKEKVKVFYQLERPSDGAVSQARTFTYQPDRSSYQGLGKRIRVDSGDGIPLSVTQGPAELSSTELLPSTIPPVPDINSSDLDLPAEILNDIYSLCCMNEAMDLESQTISTESKPSLTKYLDMLPDAITDPSDLDLNEALLGFSNESEILGVQGNQDDIYQSKEHELAFDGPLQLSNPKVIRAQMDDCNDDIQRPLNIPKEHLRVAEHQGMILKEGSPTALLCKKLKEAGRPITHFGGGANFRMDSPSTPKLGRPNIANILTENNIVDITTAILVKLSSWLKEGRLERKYIKQLLWKLFERTVGDNGDSILHILAGDVQHTKKMKPFVNLLRSNNLSKAILSLTNKKYETPLHVAARQGSVDAVQTLLGAGSDVDVVDGNHDSPLHLAITRDKDAVEVVTAFVAQPFDVSVRNKHGQTYLHLAVEQKDAILVDQLLIEIKRQDLDEFINSRDDKRGNTALHMAVLNRNYDIARILLEKGADPNLKNYAEKIPLEFVFGNSDKESADIRKLLIDYGGDTEWAGLKKEIEEDDEYEDKEDSDYEEENESGKSLYSREWDDSTLFDKQTVSKLCQLLDKDEAWKLLAEKLHFSDLEIKSCEDYWSPTLVLFKAVATSKPHLTINVIRSRLDELPSSLRVGAQYIDEMMLLGNY